MKVAVDAMGGDYPLNNIEGAIKSLEDPELEIFLVGEPEKLTSNLKNFSYFLSLNKYIFDGKTYLNKGNYILKIENKTIDFSVN